MSQTNDAALESLLDNTDNRWAAATVGSQTAGRLELSTGASIMAIGGFAGSDNSPTLVQFEQYVVDGQIKYFIAGNGMCGGPGGDSGASSEISAWVTEHFAAQMVGWSTIYDVSAPTNS